MRCTRLQTIHGSGGYAAIAEMEDGRKFVGTHAESPQRAMQDLINQLLPPAARGQMPPPPPPMRNRENL